jgi:hypothetical protein
MRKVFVHQPVPSKKISWIFKICLHFPRNHFERGRGETGKNGKKMKKVVFFMESGILDPPPRGGKRFFLGGFAGIIR